MRLTTIALSRCLVGLCALATGCATYRPVTIPSATTEAASPEAAPTIYEGDAVRITLVSGKELSGKVLWVSGTALGLNRGGNYDYEERVISFAEIESLTYRSQSDGQIELGWFAAIGAALVASVYFVLRNLRLN